MANYNRDAQRRISKVVREDELKRRGSVEAARGPRVVLPTRNAVVTTTISSRSGTTKGTGTVTLYVDDGTGSGAMTVLQTGVKVWNVYGTSIATGKWVIVGVVDGLLQVLGGDC